jgi:hypothetical protein
MLTDTDRSWISKSAKSLMKGLPVQCQQLLGDILRSSSSVEVDQSLLVLFIAHRYAAGWPPDRLVDDVVAAATFPSGVSKKQILTDLVCPVRTAFVGCQLGLEKYWDPFSPWMDFVVYQIVLRTEAGEISTAIAGDLKKRWASEDPSPLMEIANARRTVRKSAADDIVSWSRSTAEPTDRAEKLTLLLNKVKELLPEKARQQPTLVSLAQAGIAIAFIKLIATEGAIQASDELDASLKRFDQELSDSLSGLCL